MFFINSLSRLLIAYFLLFETFFLMYLGVGVSGLLDSFCGKCPRFFLAGFQGPKIQKKISNEREDERTLIATLIRSVADPKEVVGSGPPPPLNWKNFEKKILKT